MLLVTSEIEASKQQAAWAAVDGHILPHHTVSFSLRLVVSCGWSQIWNVGHRNRLRYVYFIKCGTERMSRREIGSTVPYVVERIVAQGAEVNRNRVFIPTGTSKHPSSVTTRPILDSVGYIRIPVQGTRCCRQPATRGCRSIPGH